MNVEIITRIISEKKTILPSLRNYEKIKIKAENEKNKQIINEQHRGMKWIIFRGSEISLR